MLRPVLFVAALVTSSGLASAQAPAVAETPAAVADRFLRAVRALHWDAAPRGISTGRGPGAR